MTVEFVHSVHNDRRGEVIVEWVRLELDFLSIALQSVYTMAITWQEQRTYEYCVSKSCVDICVNICIMFACGHV